MIAIFDSGYGGLTVLKPIMELLPEYDYLYLGDNARAPYGNHSQDNIKKFSEEAVDYLFKQGATLIIFACNTTSAVALRSIQEKYLKGKDEQDRKILGVLIPAAEEVVKRTKTKNAAVVGTKATMKSKSYDEEIHKLDPKIRITSKSCPLLVPFIEEGWHKKPEAISVLKKYLRPLKTHNPDTLILGCTHYPIMEDEFKKIMGKKVNVISSGDVTAKSLKEYLARHPEIEEKLQKNRKREYQTTDDPKQFKNFIEKTFKLMNTNPKKVEITS